MRERKTKDPRNKDNTKPSSQKEREKAQRSRTKKKIGETNPKNQVFLCVDPVWRFHHPRNPPIDVSSSCCGGTTTRPSSVPRGTRACAAPLPPPATANAAECPWCESDCEPLPLERLFYEDDVVVCTRDTAVAGAIHRGRRRRRAPMALPNRRIAVERRYAPQAEPHHPRRLIDVAPRTHARHDPRRV